MYNQTSAYNYWTLNRVECMTLWCGGAVTMVSGTTNYLWLVSVQLMWPEPAVMEDCVSYLE